MSLNKLNSSYYMPSLSCEVYLQDKHLWEKFSEFGTEMIVTKKGRCMFPTLKILLRNLKPNSIYNVYVRMLPISKCRYQKEQWVHESINHFDYAFRYYLYPECPANGLFLMRNSIEFSRMKITNDPTSNRQQIYLKSLHQYRPEFIIEELSIINNMYEAVARTVATFAQTEFIAVTAYQNQNVIRLKIDNNPFAKGFRENSSKRKLSYDYCVRPSRLRKIGKFTDFSIQAILDSDVY